MGSEMCIRDSLLAYYAPAPTTALSTAHQLSSLPYLSASATTRQLVEHLLTFPQLHLQLGQFCGYWLPFPPCGNMTTPTISKTQRPQMVNEPTNAASDHISALVDIGEINHDQLRAFCTRNSTVTLEELINYLGGVSDQQRGTI